MLEVREMELSAHGLHGKAQAELEAGDGAGGVCIRVRDGGVAAGAGNQIVASSPNRLTEVAISLAESHEGDIYAST